MDSLLNSDRPSIFCPGCAHERVLYALDRTLMDMGYTGIENPSVVIALASEGVRRRKKTIEALSAESVVVKAAGVELPSCQASIIEVDFKAKKIKSQDWALAALAVLAMLNKVLSTEMLMTALKLRFKKVMFEMAMAVTAKIAA